MLCASTAKAAMQNCVSKVVGVCLVETLKPSSGHQQ